MVTTAALLGMALLFAPESNPARRRLAGLAGLRLPARDVSRPPELLPSRWLPWLAAGVVAMVGAALAGPVPAAVLVLVCTGALRLRRMLGAERDADRTRGELIDAVGAVIDEYRAGATAADAYAAAAPVAGRFASVLGEAGALAARGVAPERTLTAVPALAPVAVASAIAGRTGASLAEVLTGVRSELRADRSTRRAVQAAVAGPRSSAVMLTGLPVVGLAMGTAIGAHPMTVLLHTPLGQALLCIGVVLDLAGLGWILTLTRQQPP